LGSKPLDVFWRKSLINRLVSSTKGVDLLKREILTAPAI
jgi:hypothetical protein